MTDLGYDEQVRRFNRRAALRAAGASGLGLATLGLVDRIDGADEAWAAETAATCTLTAEQTEGPYYVDLERVRRNIKETRTGLRLRLQVAVIDTRSCERLPNAAVDIWHCDALGDYSGVNGDETTFLRGIQVTNARGLAAFETIYPGWYQGRATHIHVKVHVGGRVSGATYTGGHVSHTGQLFLPDAKTDVVMKRLPYRRHTGTRTRNAADRIYTGQGGVGAVVRLARMDAASLTKGYRGTVVLGIDPSATPSVT